MSTLPIVQIEPRDGAIIATVHCQGFNYDSTARFKDEILEHTVDAETIIIDLSKVEFMPSATIGALIQLAHTLEKKQQRLMLVGLQDTVRKVIQVSRLDGFFKIHTSVEDALNQGETV